MMSDGKEMNVMRDFINDLQHACAAPH